MRQLPYSLFKITIIYKSAEKMATSEVIHSFLEDTPSKRHEENLFIRFIRKKFKCLIIFFLTLCVVAETFIVAMDKVNFSHLTMFLDKLATNNLTIDYNE